LASFLSQNSPMNSVDEADLAPLPLVTPTNSLQGGQYKPGVEDLTATIAVVNGKLTAESTTWDTSWIQRP